MTAQRFFFNISKHVKVFHICSKERSIAAVMQHCRENYLAVHCMEFTFLEIYVTTSMCVCHEIPSVI